MNVICPFLITQFNLILIQRYCHNKKCKYGKLVGRQSLLWKEFVFGVSGIAASLTVCWSTLTTPCHSARLSACQAQRAAARQNQRALIQPATGSPLHPFSSQALPMATTTPHPCTHTHAHAHNAQGFNYDKLAKS